MKAYDVFSRYFDALNGDRRPHAAFIEGLIERHHPKAESVLELGCGTGALLHVLSGRYEVAGLELSPKMLSVARRRLPHVSLQRGDMTNFSLNRKYDVVLCVFDSINHVLTLRGWSKVFAAARDHLNPGGLFLFDMVTMYRLRREAESERPWGRIVWPNVVFFTVSRVSRQSFDNNVKIFQRRKGRSYELLQDTIREAVFDVKVVRRKLAPMFKHVRLVDSRGSSPSRKAGRIYFVCAV